MHDAPNGPNARHALAAEQRTDHIVAAALAEFAHAGYAGATVGDIARRAGTTAPALLRAFASKEEIFREVVRSTLVGVLRTMEAPHLPPAHQSTQDAVRDFAHRYWSTMQRPELTALLRLTIAELPRFPELAVFHTSETLERFLHELERIIERGIERGELHALDVRAAARTVLATLAAHALWFAHPDVYAGLIGPDLERAAAATIESVLRTLSPVMVE